MNKLLASLICSAFIFTGCATTAVPKLVLPEIESSLLIPPPDLKTIQPVEKVKKNNGTTRANQISSKDSQ